jgi:hypothetical protein
MTGVMALDYEDEAWTDREVRRVVGEILGRRNERRGQEGRRRGRILVRS